jgi:hypothetical protein
MWIKSCLSWRLHPLWRKSDQARALYPSIQISKRGPDLLSFVRIRLEPDTEPTPLPGINPAGSRTLQVTPLRTSPNGMRTTGRCWKRLRPKYLWDLRVRCTFSL